MLPNLRQYKRIAIVGRPRVGKTTLGEALAKELGRDLVKTDDFMHLPFEEVPQHVIRQVKNKPSFIIEGVQAARALKYGLEVDVVVWLETENAVEGQHKGLASMVVNSMREYRGPLVRVVRIGKEYTPR